ncbi:MAG: glycosyltransferase family 39 protein, partial [Nitrospirota bacterium]|nr:glycosyltransferase family 39 protein [Nitrospirota bacterium]
MTKTSIFSFSTPKTQMQLFWLAVMSAAAVFRFVNLGQLGLWGDEGYSALSAQAILDYGYPRLPSGGTYPRSLAFLYLEGLSVKIFGLNEFALRFPAAIMGLFAILISYKLSNHLFGVRVALVVVVLMAFSNWEIEFSRNARMYTFFQFFFLLSVYVFYRGVIEGEKRYQWFVTPVWIFTLFAHQLSITLMAILIIPLFLKNFDLKKKWFLFPGLLVFALLWVFGNRLQRYLRFGGLTQNPTSGGGKLPIAVPQTDLMEALVSGSDLVAFIAISLVCGLLIFLFRRSLKDRPHRMAYRYLIFIVGAVFFNQIALAFVFLMGYTFLFFNDLQSWKQKPFLIACAICVSGFFFWLIFGLS